MKENRKKNKKKITFFADFKQFILRGNILDLAVAVIIGGAFGKIVTSLVNDIIMPVISLILGGVSFSDLKWVIREADEAKGITETALNYGNFIQTTIDFLIIALCIFLAIRFVSNVSRRINQLSGTVKQAVSKDVDGGAATTTKTETAITANDSTATATTANETAATETAAAETIIETKPTQEELLTEIRDLLRSFKP